MRSFCFVLIAATVLSGCFSKGHKADPKLLSDQNLLHRNEEQLRDVLILDMFSPPVSSRIFSYSSLAAYEAVRFAKPDNESITARLKGFEAMPQPEKGKDYNYLLAATRAFFTVAEKITFSKDSLIKYENEVYPGFQSLLDKETYERSMN